MAFFVVHCYTTLMAEYFYDALDLQSPDPLVCETLATCFVYMVNQGLRNGGGIGDSMKPEPLGDRFFAKNIYELTFFIIINVISLNIIFGVIIDTFSQLRDEQQERSKFYHLNQSYRARTGSRDHLLRVRQHEVGFFQTEHQLQPPHLKAARSLDLHLLHFLHEEKR
jgi:Ion transport protein